MNGWQEQGSEELDAKFRAVIRRVQDFQHDFDGYDPVWRIPFKDERRRWNGMRISYYRGTWYVSCEGAGAFNRWWLWEVPEAGRCQEGKQWSNKSMAYPELETLDSVLSWLDKVAADWFGTYREVQRLWPRNERWGMIPRAVVRELLPEYPDPGKEAGPEAVADFCRLVESHYYEDRTDTKFRVAHMNAGTYLELCRIGLAAIDKELDPEHPKSGAEYYAENSYNGSSGSILELPPDSEEVFLKWLRCEDEFVMHDGRHHFWMGPHRIHLNVTFKKGEDGEPPYLLSLYSPFASATADLAKMAVAYHKAGVNVYLCDAKEIRAALLAEDDISIVPRGVDTRYQCHHGTYESEWLDELIGESGRYRELRPFINFRPVGLVRPKTVDYAIHKEETKA